MTYARAEARDKPQTGYSPILRANNLGEHGLLLDDLVFVPDAKIAARQRVLPNDVVIATSSGSLSVVGKAVQAREGFPGGFGAFCKVLRPGPTVDPHYFGHFFSTQRYRLRISALAAGANINNLRNEHLSTLSIPLPPLTEQKRIARILDAANELRAKGREALAQLDMLVQSVFVDMFGDPHHNPKGWDDGVIGDLLESATYGTSKKANTLGGSFPVLRMNNITYTGAWDFSDLKYVDLTDREQSTHLVHKGQLLFNRTNSAELVGKTAVYRRDEPMAFAGYLVRGVTNEQSDSEYIGAYLNTPFMKLYLRSKCKSIVGMANINATELKQIPIPKPPADLQRRFAAFVHTLEEDRALHQSHLTELDTLFASLQQRAFVGELTA